MKIRERKFICLDETKAIDFFKAALRVLVTRNWVVIYKYSAESEDGLQYYDIIVCARRVRGTVEFKQIVDEVSAN